MIHFSFMANVVDIKIAFLYGNLREDIYMGCPPSMKYIGKDDYIILGKCICGLVKAT